MITINGKEYVSSSINLKEYLDHNNYNISHIAIEKNGAILPKSKYNEEILKDGDVIEIVSFVGGG